MIADGVYLPKEKNSKDVGHFRPISLLNVEGKMLFAVTAVQKGDIPGIAGCLEYGNMILEAIQKAKIHKKDLDVIWLDLANANLRMYHIPEEISKMLETYFDGFLMRLATKEYTTN